MSDSRRALLEGYGVPYRRNVEWDGPIPKALRTEALAVRAERRKAARLEYYQDLKLTHGR